MAITEPRPTALYVTAAFFSLVLALGGAGTQYPLIEMGLEIASILVILYFASRLHGRSASPDAIFVLSMIGVIILIPVLQLVPLPPAIWQNLPGRQRAVEVLTLIGRADQYMPISLDPEA